MFFNLFNKNVNKFVPIISSENDTLYHLIFHLHSINHEKIHYAIEKLKQSAHIFNGYKILTVSSPDNQFHNNFVFQKIIDELYTPNTIIIPVINSNKTKESGHFFKASAPLLKAMLGHNDTNKNFVFFGHSKGCSYPEKDFAMTCWVNTLWKYNIDLFYNLVKPQLESGLYDFIGCLKTSQDCAFGSPFHYAGTFFWFNANIILQNDNWYKPYDHLLSLEMWPGLVSTPDKALCLFDLGEGNKYRFDFWYNKVFYGRIDKPYTIVPKSNIS